jgi:hypothetical protein
MYKTAISNDPYCPTGSLPTDFHGFSSWLAQISYFGSDFFSGNTLSIGEIVAS